MDMSTYLAIGGWFIQVIFDKYLSYQLRRWAADCGISHEMDRLRVALLRTQSALRGAEVAPAFSHGALLWMRELRDVMYDAEDLLDKLEYHRLRQQVEEPGAAESSSSPLGAFMQSRFGSPKDPDSCPEPSWDRATKNQLLKVLERLEQVASGVSEALSLPRNIEHGSGNVMTSSIVHGGMVGRDSEAQRLVSALLSSRDENPVSAVSVVGVGGIGKTALAQHAYNNASIVEHFDVRMWVCVTDRFDQTRLTKEMLESVSSSRVEHEGMTNFNQLQVALRARLVSKRFLLVFDDVWNNEKGNPVIEHETWEKLLAPLMAGAKGSKILVTTRSRMVAKMLRSADPITLNGLQDGDCWSLIKASVFDETSDASNAQLEAVGRKIAKKLHGLPLAAKAVAGLLKGKHEAEEWNRVLQRNGVWDDIMPILRLSYEHLPPHLQRCFAYCSIFPKDWLFEADQLVLLWMAQGFVQPNGCSRMEDIGKEYIHDLFRRSFFEEQKKGFVSYFVMHDLMHDLAMSVSAEECIRIEDDEPKSIPPSVRHLSVRLDSLSALNKTVRYKNLRTFIFFSSRTAASLDYSVLQQVLHSLRCVRVLDLSPCKMERLPKSIRHCVHLRYLSLSSTSFSALPDFLCRLYHLQVLNLSGCRLERLPSGMNNLVNLRHLTASNQIVSSIPDIGRLTCLQRLPLFRVTKEAAQSIDQLGDLRELCGSLHIRNLENVETPEEARKAMLGKKDQLAMLQLLWDSTQDGLNAETTAEVLEAFQPHPNLRRLDIMGWMGAKSPSWLERRWLTNLELIYLSGCNAWECLPPLGQLPSVRIIWLQRMQAVQRVGPEVYGDSASGEPFQSLEELVLDEMPELKDWSWNRQMMRNLRSVVVKDCTKLQDLPPLPPRLTEMTAARRGFWVPYYHDAAMAQTATATSTVSSLCIYNCPMLLTRLSSPVTEEVKASFLSLKSLNIGDMSMLRLPLVREMLEYIWSLDIQDCTENVSFDAEEEDALRQLRSLQSLCISGCGALQSLPSTLHSLESLEKLVLWNCPEVASLPEEGLPPSLKVLEVVPCHPLLKEKCKKEDGMDWPKIVHIPRIEIDGEVLLRIPGAT